MEIEAGSAPVEESSGDTRLAILLAMAMFVLVVDTSLMNVSISAVVHDLDTTASGVQSAIALEALVSAAFILISSKVGDLIGRKRAYVLGLLGYAVGALAMTLAQSLDRDHHLLGDHRRARRVAAAAGHAVAHPRQLRGRGAEAKAYALVGAAAAIAAAVGPLLGGFVTTYLSWRVGFLLEVVIIAVVLSGIKLVKDVAVHRRRGTSTSSARCCRSSAWAASCSASSSGRRAARRSRLLIAVGAVALGAARLVARPPQARRAS